MNDIEILNQAKTLASILPRVMRLISTIDDTDPATELPVAQIRVCNILCDGPRTMSSLGKELGVSLSAMTQIADRLEGAGLVERVSEPGDRRVRTLQLTPRGEEIMRSRRERRVERLARILEALPPESRSDAILALQTLLDAGAAAGVRADRRLDDREQVPVALGSD